jgi:hypothetical protein
MGHHDHQHKLAVILSLIITLLVYFVENPKTNALSLFPPEFRMQMSRMASETSNPLQSISAHKAFALKILPTVFTEEYLLHGQNSFDWSAVYAQFNVEHAVSYLPNHFDRGFTSADLVVISTKEDPLNCVICQDEHIAISSLSSAEKARLLMEHIQSKIDANFGRKDVAEENQPTKPLLQRVGESLQASVVLLDAEKDFEMAIPHCLMTDARFQYRRLVRFQRDPVVPWKVKEVHLYKDDCEELAESLSLTKDEKEDAALLGTKLQDILADNINELDMWKRELS